MSDKNAIVPVEQQYPALVGDFQETMADLADVLGPDGDTSILPRIKVPAGGGIAWEVADENGELQPKKSVRGIVLKAQPVRRYYAQSMDDGGGNTPPSCYSENMVTGIALDPENAPTELKCSSCPYAQYGSAHKGEGMACGTRYILSVLLEGDMLPTIIDVPPTSYRDCKKYLLLLVNKRKKPHSVLTEFSLVKDKNKAGTDYAKIVFSGAGPVPEELVESAKGYAAMLNPPKEG